jgi:Na+/proline symporter
MLPDITDRGKLWAVRLTVLVLSIVAFMISFSSEGIKELVETASAFGSAGVFVATLFALFTRFGGPLSAYASISAGMIIWAAGKYGFGLGTPYLLGLLSALVSYIAAALVENRR